MYKITLKNGEFVGLALEKTPWYQNCNITDQNFIQKVNSKCLTKDYLESLEITFLLRSAHHNDYIKLMVKKYMKYEPLPILPFIINTQNIVTLKPHQLAAMEFMRKRESLAGKVGSFGLCGGILHMKMGLMKTLTSISHSIITPKITDSPTLIIASKTIMTEWKNDGFKKFFGKNIKVMYFHPDNMGQSYLSTTCDDMKKFAFVVTTYDITSRASEKLRHPLYEILWERIICDESQTFANPETLICKSVLKLKSKYKWCLTGTPVRNNSSDLWSQLKFCGYCFIKTKTEWEENKIKVMVDHNLNNAIFSANYDDVGIKLPEKKLITKKITLANLEKECYDKLLLKLRTVFKEMKNEKNQFANILALFMRLRQTCIAPYLLTNKVNVTDDGIINRGGSVINKTCNKFLPWMQDINGTAGIYSSKISAIIDILSNIPKKEKIIIFSSFSSALTLLSYAISVRQPKLKVVQVDGDVKGPERTKKLDDFRFSDTRILLMTYKVGSAGLNLTQANHIIYIEKFWNNATHDQAAARAWRPGQEKNVFLYDIHVQDSIEDRIKDICDKKDEIIETTLMGSVVINTKKMGLTKEMIGSMIGEKN